jgi:hypothetical protein
MTLTMTDERVISTLRQIINLTQPDNAFIRFDGVCAHPMTGSQTYQTGMVYGRTRTLEDLYDFLGEKGFIDTIRWEPLRGRDYMQVTIHHGGQALSVTNCFTRPSGHYVGFRGAKWMPEESTPDHQVDPAKIRHHIVDTEEEMTELVLKLLRLP